MLGQMIAVPAWLLAGLAVLALWSVLDHLLIPSVRWFFRDRINRAVDEINRHLRVQLRPFQLTKRQVLVDRLVYDPLVLEKVQDRVRQDNIPREWVMDKVARYAKEIVPAFNALIYFRIGYWVARRIVRALYRVRVDFSDQDRLAEINPDATLVFVINHRSNMDYIMVSLLAAEHTALSYAVGEWARTWPLQTLIHAMGGYFVRRRSGNPLYRLVLERYVRMATREGVCQAVFPEGGLSRDGRLQPPRLGILDYMLRGFSPKDDRDIVFIPVGINYDRTLEDRSLLRALDPDAERRSRWFVAKTSLGFAGRNLLLMLRNKWRRFGYACVQFGRPVSMTDYCGRLGICFRDLGREDRFEAMRRLGQGLMDEIRQIVPAVPTALVAEVLMAADDAALPLQEIRKRAAARMETLRALKVRVYPGPEAGMDDIDRAVAMMKLRRMVTLAPDGYRTVPETRPLIAYYANALSHWRKEGEE